jgi:hypothetical protein
MDIPEVSMISFNDEKLTGTRENTILQLQHPMPTIHQD